MSQTRSLTSWGALPSWGAVQRHQRGNVTFGGASRRPFYATIANILITSPRGKGILGSKGVVTNGNLLLPKGPSPKTCFILVNKPDIALEDGGTRPSLHQDGFSTLQR